ncbi:MAG: alginate export family protein [Candidatus Omnitrophota bacterium]|nr:MAG: alginate export family protein [Candidatus Omnitrophota bacterium]
MKLIRIACVLGLTLCLATSVYAGTQSVKISGDVTVRAILRSDYDLDEDNEEPATVDTTGIGTGTSDWQEYFMSTAEVQVDANLTDNVSAVIRLFNQRDWGDDNATTDEFDVGMDLMYVELKEFLYSPLTLKIGRQDIWIGKGFIVGANISDYNSNINANEYSCATSFDAIRATLDYDPWTIDGIAAKLAEGHISSSDDNSLFGVNVGYIFDFYNGEAEAYWFYKNDANTTEATEVETHNTVHTIGLRGSADPVESWTAAAEGAVQFGDYVGFTGQLEDRDRLAWALDVSAECRYFTNMFVWKPVIGAEYVFYSGDGESDPDTSTSDDYNGWDVMSRGKFDSKIRDFYGLYYNSAMCADETINPESALTNQHSICLYGSIEPLDGLTVDAKCFAYWQPESRTVNDAGLDIDQDRDEYLGTELDLELTWDYTEDVSFSVLTAWFFPGDFYASGYDDTCSDLVGSMKLSF